MSLACYRDETVVPPSPASVQQLRFGAGLPGFPTIRRFTVEPYGGPDSPFLLLSADDDEAVRFIVVAPQIFFPDYTPAITAEALGSIGLDDPGAALVWVVIALAPQPKAPTANLLGPLVINPASGEAVQAVQVRGDWSAAAPIPIR